MMAFYGYCGEALIALGAFLVWRANVRPVPGARHRETK